MTLARRFDPSNVTVNLVTDSLSAHQFIDWIKTVPDQLIGLDVETDGLNWYDGTLRLVQFGTLDTGWAVPFQEWRYLVTEALRYLTERNKFFVGHNFKFDLHWIERNTGWLPPEWRYVHDTMLLASVLSSSGSKALKDLSEFYVWPGAKIGQQALHDDMKRGGWDWGTVPVTLPSYWIYGVLDTILTVNLFYVLLDKCQAAGCMEAYTVEMGAFPVLYSIERKGMLLDSDHCIREQEALLRRAYEIEAELAQYDINNVASTAQIALALERGGVELTAKTDTGKWKMDKDTFEILAATQDHPVLHLVEEHRMCLKVANTYYANFLAYQRSDGRCHPFYRPTGAKTGRMSATEPAIQTVPRPDVDKAEWVRQVRNAFVAPQGFVLVSTDFSNVEARIFADFADEEGMKQAFREGLNLHKFTASKIFNKPYDSIDKQNSEYTTAKNTLFCLPTTTKALTIDGPKHVDELRVGDLVAGYRSDGMVDWTPIRAIHRPGVQEVITFGNRHRRFRATADHRWVAERRIDRGAAGRKWESNQEITTEKFLLSSGDTRLVLSAQFDQVDRSGLTPGQACLLGWLITDGHVRWSSVTSGCTSQAGGRKVGVQGRIAQTKHIGRFEIENLLAEYIRHSDGEGYDVHPQAIRDLFDATGLNRDYSNLSAVVLRMGMKQITEFCRAVWFAEGTQSTNTISQNRGPKYDAIRLAVFMNGMFPGMSRVVKTDYDTSHICCSFSRGARTMTAARVQEFERNFEEVWCISTDLDSFVAVDDDTYFLTRNCKLFGGGAEKIAATAGIPIHEAEIAVAGLNAAFPGMKAFQQRSIQIAKDNLQAHGQAFIRAIDGRILSMVETDDRYYAFTNWQIQSAACITLKRRLAVIDALGLTEYCVAAIHDEVVAEIPEEYEEEFKELITEAMTDEYSFSLPIVCATGEGAVRWGDAK